MLLELFIVVIILLLITVSYTLYFSLQRITQYEEILIQFDKIISLSSEKLKQVDSQGHYEADDETGFFFETIQELQSALDDLFESEDNKLG